MRDLPELQIITYEEETLKVIIDQLCEVGLDNYCYIKGSNVETIRSKQKANLFLFTNKSVYKMVEKYIDPYTPYIFAKRLINFSNIKKLLSIPMGSRVYLVSNLKDAAKDTIETLTELGIVHRYIPYYGQKEIDTSIKIAITPGEREYVPKTVNKVIDIGHRLLDMTTIIEIHEFFNIPIYNSDHKLTARYINSLISIIDELNEQVIQTKGLEESIINIVDHFDQGIIIYDVKHRIITINQSAIEILKMNDINECIHLKDIPNHFYEVFMKIKMDQNHFINMEHNESYYFRKRRILLGQKVFATVIIFERVERINELERDFRRSKQKRPFSARYTFSDIRIKSSEMTRIIQKAKRLARSDSTIFIQGETGTGKEIMAQAIHSESPRSDGPFVAVNLSAIPSSLAESELFGYEKGAFTGAHSKGNIGYFEKAHKGTIFLDEIGDISPNIQNLLLRVLQEKEIQRIGGGYPIPIDVRVITATNKNLLKLIKLGKFREDLFYRLNILPINLPPLRERKDDIALLANLFSKEFEEKLHRSPLSFSPEALQLLESYSWPGNVRELRNTIEYLAHVSQEEITAEDLSFLVNRSLVTNNNSDEESIILNLKEKGFLSDCYQILKIYKKTGENGIGRYKLMNVLKDKDVKLTEQKVRYRLKLLADFKLIEVGKGRRGSRLSERGKRFLNLLETEKMNFN